MPHTLYYFKGDTAWMVDFRRAPNAAEVLDSFGTTTLPTPYAPTMPEATLVQALQARDPDARLVNQDAIGTK